MKVIGKREEKEGEIERRVKVREGGLVEGKGKWRDHFESLLITSFQSLPSTVYTSLQFSNQTILVS